MKHTDHNGQIGRGAVFILAGKVGTFVLTASQALVIPKVLGPESMGFYAYWLSVYIITATMLELGGFSILSRYLPEFWATNRPAIRPLLVRVTALKIPSLCLISMLGWFIFPDNRALFFIVVLGAAALSPTALMGVLFYSRKEMGIYTLIGIVRLFLRIVLILGLFYFLGNMGILLALLGSSLLTAALFGRVSIQILPKSHGRLPQPFKYYFTYGIWTYLSWLSLIMTEWLVVVMARRFIDDMAIIGYLGFGLHIGFFIRFLSVSVGEVVFPSLVEFFVRQDKRFAKTIELNWKYTNMLLFPMVAGALLLFEPVIRLVIGEEFLPSAQIAKWILPAVVFSSWRPIHRQILSAHEKKKQMFLVSFTGFVVFFITGLVLIRLKGIVGAPMSLGLGSLAGYVCALVLSGRLEKIPGYLVSMIRPMAAAALMGVILSVMPAENIFQLLMVVFTGAVIYTVMMYLIGGITLEDVKRLKKMFSPNGR